MPTDHSAPNIGQKEYGSVSTLGGYSVFVNCLIGSTAFALPYAFYSAGIPLTSAVLVFFLVLTMFTAWWVLELLARTHGYVRAGAYDEDHPDSAEGKPLLEQAGVQQPENRIEKVKYSFTDFSYVFGGPVWRDITQVITWLCSYGALWSYAASFSSSLAMFVFKHAFKESCNIYHDPSPACTWTYYGGVALYGLIVIPLCLMSISEQKYFQYALTIYRFASFALMLATVIVAYVVSGPLNGGKFVFNSAAEFFLDESVSDSSVFESLSSAVDDGASIWSFKWKGFGVMFASTALSLGFHANIPDVATPCENKKALRTVVGGVTVTGFTFYLLVGTICAIFFNPPDPLVTLNWETYTGRNGGWGEGEPYWWASVIQVLIILFPVIQLVNVYPLVAIALASNMNSYVTSILDPKKDTVGQKVGKFIFGSDTNGRHRHWVTGLLSSVPPLIGACISGELDIIFSFTGIFDFALEFLIPAVFQCLSVYTFVKRWGKGSEKTDYTGWHSKPFVAWFTIVVGVIAAIVSLTFTIMDLVK